MLFGATSGHFGERHSMFSSGSPASETPVVKKTFVSPLNEAKGSVSGGASLRDFSDKEGSPLNFGSGSSKTPATIVDEKRKDPKDARENKESKDKEDDAWDIPAFLRRRKK
jgi:hypothetical protein